ncbi:type II toxin-antitoxin system RelE/ParE family toxin [Clostridiaceae bacterium UIB06]|uniref:Type II toxin-antitoxin system RelE/ParE family toxin n=1 Tax=Clostridium thailandense TaxID=2794346 RepID=A0A949TQZ3_9CLOT|nr:type II toxin-antitoxin system RelE/ParE family toxin [Clostridium thailandense]MBV7271646.1 type II toxin-antitoxin system RelE/ParE family toxin [Clostridium thailandense]MCH5136383.1 type II toxin-antitoxin system RelE/ParE family toxin [Clostridiaceae bacterium UIB06]
MATETYKTKGGKDVITEYIDQLEGMEKARAKIILESLEKDGLEALEYMNTRQLSGKLYEIKFDNSRFMYVVIDCNLIHILHACKKQKGKTSQSDLNTAKKRAVKLGKKLGKTFV